MTQEIAYGSQLVERRRRVHAAVARVLQSGDPGVLDENADAARWLHQKSLSFFQTGADLHRPGLASCPK